MTQAIPRPRRTTSPRVRARFARGGTGRRFLHFSQVGLTVLAAGYALLWFLVDRLHVVSVLAYALQAVVSVELNFALNYHFTWRDRRGKLWTRFAKFNLSRAVVAVACIGPFAAFSATGMHYLVANALCTGVAILLNFLTADRWVFTTLAASAATQPLLSDDSGLRSPASRLEARLPPS